MSKLSTKRKRDRKENLYTTKHNKKVMKKLN